MQDDNALLCPSFSSYTTDHVAETASRVAGECAGDLESIAEELYEDEEEFEFSILESNNGRFTISADELANCGQIDSNFPVFDRHLLQELDFERQGVESIRVPMKNLFFEEHDQDHRLSCSSSSDVEEPESMPKTTKFCVWAPVKVATPVASPERCKKSKSTGSCSRRWRFIDLLRRSNSTDEKDSFVFLTPVSNSKKKKEGKSQKSEKVEQKISGDGRVAGKSKKFSSAHEMFYAKNHAMKEGQKRKSFLPYRQDLVGFFAKVNGLGRKYPPF